MTNPAEDSELMSVFTLDDDEEDSDDEYFPWNLSGRTLQDVESPYDKAVRIQLANRELFSEPNGKKKLPNRVKLNLVPKEIIIDRSGKITEENMSSNSKMQQKRRSKDLYRRRQTPPLIMPPRPSLSEVRSAGRPAQSCANPPTNHPHQNKDNHS